LVKRLAACQPARIVVEASGGLEALLVHSGVNKSLVDWRQIG
jgi:hypothetical protein